MHLQFFVRHRAVAVALWQVVGLAQQEGGQDWSRVWVHSFKYNSEILMTVTGEINCISRSL